MHQEKCLNCQGDGKLACPNKCHHGEIWHATYKEKCQECRGKGYITCPNCHGKGVVVLRGRG